MQVNLRNKFLIPTFVLMIFGMCISTLVSSIYSRGALENAVTAQITGMTDNISGQLSSWVKAIQQDVTAWSQLEPYQKQLALQSQAMSASASPQAQSIPAAPFESSYADETAADVENANNSMTGYDADGIENNDVYTPNSTTEYTSIDNAPSDIYNESSATSPAAGAQSQAVVGMVNAESTSQKLAMSIVDSPYYEFVGLADTTGTVICSTDYDSSNPKMLHVADKEFFKTSMTDEVYISDIFRSDKSSNPVFIVSAPMFYTEVQYDVLGRLMGTKTEMVGVIYAVIDLNYFSKEYIHPVTEGKKAYAFICNKGGLVVAHSDHGKIFNFNIKNLDFGKDMIKQKAGVITYTHNKVESIASFEGLPKHGWTVVAGIGTKEAFSPVRHMTWVSLIIGLAVAGILAFILWMLTGTLILKPVSRVAHGLKDIAEGEGDLTRRLEEGGQDEVGTLSKWLNIFLEKLGRIIMAMSENADSLNASSVDLSNLSGNMSRGAENMTAKFNAVAMSADEMSGNINSVASAMKQASNNMNLVATAAEEMTSTINEIAQNSEKARTITGAAVSQSNDASKKIDELGRAAQEIGKVTEAITEISEQTNLLALNATIEAARAGEAGKGFAVVANEIKELARQTAEATQDIKNRISSIQSTTSESVSQVEGISKVINEVHEIVATIATAVEEQSVSTKDIAENVSQASFGIQEVSDKVENGSAVAGQIAADITEVNQACIEISNGSSQVDLSANELAELAELLKSLVGKFKLA